MARFAVLIAVIWIWPGCTDREQEPETPDGTRLPDFAAIRDVPERKQRFCDFLRPFIVRENARVAAQRERIEQLRAAHLRGDELRQREIAWLRVLAEECQIDNFTVGGSQAWQRLLRRVDGIPLPLVLMQAANESAWGTSRMAREGLALFGQWYFGSGKSLTPQRREPDQTHTVKVFDSVGAAVRSYLRNLNTHVAYRELRAMRQQQRRQGEKLDGHLLAGGLANYSARGIEYVREIRRMLRSNAQYTAAPSAQSDAGADSCTSAVILQYHHFGSDTPPSTSISLEQFEAHLRYLADQQVTVWPIETVVDHLQRGALFPDPCVAITIDDAYASVYDEALPRLQRRGWPFCVFASSGAVDSGYAGYLSWKQMRTMQEAGVTFGNHSATHAHLVRRREGESREAWRARVRGDILACQGRIREELGCAPRLFAYPFGEYDPELREIVTSLDLIGFGQQSGAVWAGSDLGVLPRFPLSGIYAGLEGFAVKVRSLALPVVGAEPDSPILSWADPPPILRLRLAPGDYRADQFAAYAGGERITLDWIDRDAGLLEVSSDEPLPAGRSRFNLTAPARQGDRYYWYSHLWIRGDEHHD